MVSKTKHKQNKGYLFDDTPRGILEALLITGGGVLALTFAPTLFIALASAGFILKADDKQQRRKLSSSFQYLKQKHYVKVKRVKDSMHIELTETGRKKITHHLRDRQLARPPERPSVWDKKWRIILFDIPAGDRSKRNAFRSLIHRLGAIMLQKSVWIYPFDCSEQIGLLREVFQFSSDELRLVVADSIEDDASFRKHFRL